MNTKKSFFMCAVFVCIMALGVACSRSEKLQGNEFIIEGRLSGVEDGTVINLSRANGFVGMRVASDTVMNGRFTLRGEAESDLEQLRIYALGKDIASSIMFVWVTPVAKVKIKGKGKIIPLWNVKGSVSYQKEENRFTKNKRDIITETNPINLNIDELFEKIQAATSSEEADAYRQTRNSLMKESSQLTVKGFYADMSLLEKMDISPVWLQKLQHITLFLQAYDELRPKLWALFGRMSEEDKNTPIGAQIIDALTPYNIVEVGDDIADANLLDLNGNIKHLSDYLDKYLLLDFWSSGCGPCIMALPEMKEISETYSDKLTIISISIDFDAVWKKAIDKFDTPWVNLRDSKSWSGLAVKYGVLGIPNYIIISPEGKIVDKWAGYSPGLLKRKVDENIK